MPKKKLIKYGIWAIFFAILVYVIDFGIKYAYIGSSYDAKIVCSCTFVSGRDWESIKAEDLYAVPFATIEIDKKEQSVTSNIYGFAKTKAIYRPGLGCTLVNEMEEEEIRKQKSPPTPGGGVLTMSNIQQVSSSIGNLGAIDSLNLQKTINEAFTELDPKNIKRTRAIVILQNGKLIAEKYATNINRNTALLGWSMTKSVTNAMVGLMVKDGKLDIKKPAPIAEWQNDNRSKITLDHLLRMSSGLDFEENYAEPSDATQMLFRKKGAGTYAMQSKPKYAPDEVWYYSSGTTNILQEIIRRKFTNLTDYQSFIHQRLFQKIGMITAVLEPDASGTFVGSSFMYATARDWAKFGQLYLQDGIWNGERILPEGWVKYSSTETPNSHGQYAAQFWLYPKEENLPSDLFQANGFEGQYVTIIPSKQLVIVRLGCTPGDGYNHAEFLRKILKSIN
jgi:CubicO group peptidase (beta-lactamase class C family)